MWWKTQDEHRDQNRHKKRDGRKGEGGQKSWSFVHPAHSGYFGGPPGQGGLLITRG